MTTARFAKSAFSGEGARLYGGRWNRKGIALVYTSQSQSLAMLEMLVQDDPLRARYVMMAAHVPKGVAVARIKIVDLPPNWRDVAIHDKRQAIGTKWAIEGKTAILEVPSAVVPSEFNYLLNPLHPDYRRIKIDQPFKVTTDSRLLKSWAKM